MPPGREFAGLSLCRTVALRALCDYSERMKQYVKHRKVVKMGCYEEVQCEGGLDINIEQFNGKPAVELLIRPLACSLTHEALAAHGAHDLAKFTTSLVSRLQRCPAIRQMPGTRLCLSPQ